MTLVRPATRADLSAVQEIYAHHVLRGTGTFEIDPPSLVEITARWEKVCARGHPWLVACDDHGAVRGYAYAGPFRERAAYARTLEDSVYVAPGAQGRGVGRALLGTLLDVSKSLGAKEMLAVVGDSGNTASLALHRALGFTDAGLLRGVGEKFGRVLDVVILQRAL
ncbi:MAG: N-acetyltransferase family protein [Polyangiales bacterium]